MDLHELCPIVIDYDDFETFKVNAQMKDLVIFHQSYKFLLQSKDENIYRELGKIVGNHEAKPFQMILKEYEEKFKLAIYKKSSIGRTRNVLEHMAGFLKNFLNHKEKQFLHMQINDYSNRTISLVKPISTLHIYALKYDVSYLLEQKFLNLNKKKLAHHTKTRSTK